MPTAVAGHTGVSLELTRAISRTRTVEEIYGAALDALAAGLGVERASILLFDPDGVMRFKAWRRLSDGYRAAVEGHTPWTPDTADPQPIVVADVAAEPSLEPFRPTIDAERIAAMTFIPLVSFDRVIGKFMLYYPAPQAPTMAELQLAGVIAAQVAFAVERTRAEAQARLNEERLRYALDAASMGTWDWDLTTNAVRWSDNLERIHGLPPGTFDGTFASYEREIHPEDRDRVLAALRRTLEAGTPFDIEYRIVAPDGSVRWCEGKGRVDDAGGRPARMSGVCMMVTRRKEAELARLAAAEEASRLKDEFLATLSHELRTPLNAILGWIQLIESGSLAAGRERAAIDVIGRNARLQTKLIEDILDVSRIITGKLEIERVPIAIASVVDAVVAGILPAATARRIRIHADVAPDLPPIEGDPKRLHQVLSNVIANAVTFTAEDGRISLECRLDGPWLRLAIADTGTGIDPEFLPFVFDRFRQADSRSTRKHGGLGLGLAIARHLVEQHGGTIDAESGGIGAGTTVVVRLPVCAGPAPAVMPAGVERPITETLPPDLSVLVVDDQRDSRELLAALLQERGARVRQCDSAAAALEALASEAVALLIADIAMPDVDGYELIRRLRASGVATPAVAVTAYARPEDRHQALTAGYDAYCAKPIDASALLQMVRTLTAR